METLQTFGVDKGLEEMLHCVKVHFDDANLACNPFGWVTDNYEISEAGKPRNRASLEGFGEFIKRVRNSWPDVKISTISEMVNELRTRYTNNDELRYFFNAKGSGIGASDPAKEIAWIMRKEYRFAILRENAINRVVDHTDYTKHYTEPLEEGARNWTLFGDINQKNSRKQDKPVLLENFAGWTRLKETLRDCEKKVLKEKFKIDF